MNYLKRGLAIEVGNETIKILEFNRNKDKIKVMNAFLIPTPENAVEDGLVRNIEGISELILEGLKEKKIKTKSAIFTVASSKIITREVDLPDQPIKKLDPLIKMNASEYFPVNLDEYTMDYRVMEHIKNDEQKLVRVNIVVVMTNVIESYLALAEKCNLKIEAIDYSGNSIVNFADKLTYEGTYMLLDFGSSNSMVTIMSDKKVRFNRNLVYGTKVVNNSIQNHFGVSYAEAVRIAHEQSLLSQQPETNDYLGSDVSSAMNQILNGISRLVDYYSSRNKDGIDHIYLVGGGTNINGIGSYVENFFNIKTTTIDQLEFISSEDATLKDNIQYFANVIGAIYTELHLLPEQMIAQAKEKAQTRVRMELGVLVLLMVGAAMYFPYLTLQNMKEEKAALEQEIAEKQVVLPIKQEYINATTSLSFYTSLEYTSASTSEILADLFDIMESVIPSEVDYLSVSNTEEGMLISCVADEKLTVVNFMEALKTMTYEDKPVFSHVYLPALTVTDGEEDNIYYTFSIACDYYVEVE